MNRQFFQTLMDKRVAALVLLGMGILLAVSPAGSRQATPLSAEELAAVITGQTDHVTTDLVAAAVIDKDPALLLVDVRTVEEYAAYHIPGAVNIPVANLLDDESRWQFESGKTVVLYSNGGTHAAQAWVLLTQAGYEAYEMQGGLNHWGKTILSPEAPSDIAADPEILQYQFRKAAGNFFQGGAELEQNSSAGSASKAPPVMQLRPRKKAGKGC
jgi:sulfur-carrier protein adenylyltransferase/sulfurtransferase